MLLSNLPLVLMLGKRPFRPLTKELVFLLLETQFPWWLLSQVYVSSLNFLEQRGEIYNEMSINEFIWKMHNTCESDSQEKSVLVDTNNVFKPAICVTYYIYYILYELKLSRKGNSFTIKQSNKKLPCGICL